MDSAPLFTPGQAQDLLAARAREARVEQGLTQRSLAARAGVALATLRHFEQTGQVSLKHLTSILHALGRLDEVEQLLRPAPAASLAELEHRLAAPRRKRGSR